MNRLQETLVDVVARLDELGFRCALVGGLAVSVHSEARFTRDIDLAVRVNDDREAESLVRSLTSEGFRVDALVEQDAAERLATVRLIAPGQSAEGIVVDLLFASSGLEAEIIDQAEAVEVFAGSTVPVVTLAHLIVLKLLSRDDDRPQDEIDLKALIDEANDEHLAEARRAIETVEFRGYSRGRDLARDFSEILRKWNRE